MRDNLGLRVKWGLQQGGKEPEQNSNSN